ncbi:MAG: hypothetical protein K6A36_06510 [Paludibacteraceae bacterium]|nr:hypothetical protein [Paludibacteraceae bacterium]
MKKTLLLLATFCCTLMVHAVNGSLLKKFTVGEGKQVIFSQGNLQYQASTNTWRFAENQYDIVGAGNVNIAADYDGWIDLFGWGTGNAPTQTSTSAADYASFTDWGINAISNGGDQTNFWRTLTKDEWDYLLRLRPNANNLVGAGTVAGVPGLIILPDVWEEGYWTTINSFEDLGINVSSIGYSCEEDTLFLQNIYDADYWTQMEYEGALFLPAAGHRDGIEVSAVGSLGEYACSTPDTENEDGSYKLLFDNSAAHPNDPSTRHQGYSVRLVKDAENIIDTIRITYEAPKAGDAAPRSGATVTSGTGTATIPDGVHYILTGYSFYSDRGNSFSENIFVQNTKYLVQFYIEPEDGYYFPTSKEGYPGTHQIVCIVNGDTLDSRINGWRFGVNQTQLGVGYIFQTSAFETPVEINELHLSYDELHVPEAGDSVPQIAITPDTSLYYSVCLVNVPERSGYHIRSYSIKDEDGTSLDGVEVFAENTTYRVEVEIEKEDGYVFPMNGSKPDVNNIRAVLNGTDMEKTNMRGGSNGRVYLYTYFTTGKIEGPKIEVDTIRITFVQPNAGDPSPKSGSTLITPTDPTFSISCHVSVPDNAGYDLLGFRLWTGGTFSNSYSETTFQENTQYKIQVHLMASEGYTFPMNGYYPDRWNMVFYMNDTPVEISDVSTWNNGEIGVTYRFTTGSIPTGLVNGEWTNGGWTKVIRDGQLYILCDGKAYNAQGVKIK